MLNLTHTEKSKGQLVVLSTVTTPVKPYTHKKKCFYISVRAWIKYLDIMAYLLTQSQASCFP